MVNLDDMKKDTKNIIAEWKQTVTIKRLAPSQSSIGQVTGTWEIVQQNGEDTIDVDIQPGGSALTRDQKGQERDIDYRIFLPDDADIQQGDRIYHGSIIMLVEEIDKNPDHIEAYANKVK